MNTVKSFWIGWGSLCVAGAGAYYFAKREIRADRHAKLEAQRRQKDAVYSMEYGNGSGNGGPARTDNVGSPSQEVSSDPAPTQHAPATESQRVGEKSKYESAVPYRNPRGDRFS